MTSRFDDLLVGTPGGLYRVGEGVARKVDGCPCYGVTWDAERLYVKAFDVQQRVLPADHPRVLSTMNNLGVLYRQQGRLDKAEPLLTDALEGRRRVFGDEHPRTGRGTPEHAL